MVLEDLVGLGGLAHLGERLICIQEVAGSIPVSSTTTWSLRLSVRTAGFHPVKGSSILPGTANTTRK